MASTQYIQSLITYPVGASALSQYALVKTPGGIVVSAADTDVCCGVVQNGYDANATEAVVCYKGRTRAIADAAISKGAELMPSAAGKVITHDGGADSPRIGIALEEATADGDEILIDLLGSYGVGTAA